MKFIKVLNNPNGVECMSGTFAIYEMETEAELEAALSKMHSCANFARIQIDLNGGDTKGFYNNLAIAYDSLSRDIERMDLSKDQRESVIDLRDRVGGLMNSISRCASTFVKPIMKPVSHPEVPYKTWSYRLVDFEDKE